MEKANWTVYAKPLSTYKTNHLQYPLLLLYSEMHVHKPDNTKHCFLKRNLFAIKVTWGKLLTLRSRKPIFFFFFFSLSPSPGSSESSLLEAESVSEAASTSSLHGKTKYFLLNTKYDWSKQLSLEMKVCSTAVKQI